MTDYTHLLSELSALQERVTLDARHRYRVDGKYGNPGVTTVSDVLDKPGLNRWKVKTQVTGTARAAYSNPPTADESEGAYIARLGRLAAVQYEHDRLADEAAQIGDGVHKLIEAHVKRMLGQTVPDPEVPEASLYRFSGWPEWAKSMGLIPLASEARLTSNRHGFCGQLDLLALYGDDLALVDFKPQSAVYTSRRLQLGAYRLILSELGWPNMRGFLNVLPRDGGPITLVEVDPPGHRLEASQQAFLACLTLYRWNQEHDREQRAERRA